MGLCDDVDVEVDYSNPVTQLYKETADFLQDE